MRSASTEWGKCPCGGQYEHRQVEVNMTVNGKPLTLSDVFQGVCPNCGSRVYKAEQLARIEAAMKDHPLDCALNSFRI